MSEHDLATRPIYDPKRESIDTHLTIAFAVPMIQATHRRLHRLVNQKIARTARRYRTVHIQST